MSFARSAFTKCCTRSRMTASAMPSSFSCSDKGDTMTSPCLSHRLCRLGLIEHSRLVIADLGPEGDVQPVEGVGRDDGDGQVHQLLFAEVISRRHKHLVGYVAVGDVRHGLGP